VNESTGIGELALALAVCYQTKMGLRLESLWIAMNVQQEEFFAAFGETINELILRHKVDLERRQWEEAGGSNVVPSSFVTEQSTSVPKARWVDGTPLYSFHICGLRKLFPGAQFIHIVRDVTSVVRSMLNFHPLAGVNLVANEQEAYDCWFRTVKRLSFGRTGLWSGRCLPIAIFRACKSIGGLPASFAQFLGRTIRCKMPPSAPGKNEQLRCPC